MEHLESLGLNENIRKLIASDAETAAGRVIAEHRDMYAVQTEKGAYNAEITGNMRYSAQSRRDLPAAGDWVKLAVYDESTAVITGIYPRYSLLERQAPGRYGEKQILAANVDYAFIVQAAGYDYNLNRLERYLSVCSSSKVLPVIILTKTDLITPAELAELTDRIRQRIKNAPLIPVSSLTLDGYKDLESVIEKGKTFCLLGSSGAGKSTIINNLLGKQSQAVSAISESTAKGRHTTTRRELFVLESGGILIDTPGMRELGVADNEEGIAGTFDYIEELSASCRFKDCTHTSEKGCAVLAAVEKGEIDKAAFENYHKLKREKQYFESTLKDKREKDKKQGKFFKTVKKELKNRKH